MIIPEADGFDVSRRKSKTRFDDCPAGAIERDGIQSKIGRSTISSRRCAVAIGAVIVVDLPAGGEADGNWRRHWSSNGDVYWRRSGGASLIIQSHGGQG